MNNWFSSFKRILIFFGYLILISLISSIFYLYTNISYNVNCTFLLISVMLGVFAISFYNGRKASKKGYLEGLKLGGIIITVFFIISLFSGNIISLSKVIYYLLLLLVSVVASSLGINMKKN